MKSNKKGNHLYAYKDTIRRLFLLTLFSFLIVESYAQKKTISGTVTDFTRQSGAPRQPADEGQQAGCRIRSSPFGTTPCHRCSTRPDVEVSLLSHRFSVQCVPSPPNGYTGRCHTLSAYSPSSRELFWYTPRICLSGKARSGTRLSPRAPLRCAHAGASFLPRSVRNNQPRIIVGVTSGL